MASATQTYYKFDCPKHAISLLGQPHFYRKPEGFEIDLSEMYCPVGQEDECQESWEILATTSNYQP